MLKKIEFTFTDGKVNPSCHVVTVEEVFNEAGESVGVGRNHRTPIDVATADLTKDPKMNLSADEKTSVGAQIAAVKSNHSIWSPPK